MFASNSSQVSSAANYIEDVFSTYLYTGTGATRSITNGIDLAGKGGLVWTKRRSTSDYHALFDTARTINYALYTNTTSAQTLENNSITGYNSDGYSFGSGPALNSNGNTFASWTFRKQPKFHDVVTYTGNGGTLSVSHSLASKPGCIIIKRTDSTGDWLVITRKSDGNIYAMYLNQTAGQFYDGTEGSLWTSTSVSINWINSNVAGGFNDSGATYVMYLFAHNAGGFGLTGTDNVISCGSWTGTGSAQDINLGYEPQFLIIKNASSGTTNWVMLDNMRGLPVGTGDAYLKPNLSDAEVATSDFVDPTATGFRTILSTMNTSGNTFIYIAIRRGPMKVPTSGTSVFSPISTSSATGTAQTTSFPVDMQIQAFRGSTGAKAAVDRLRGVSTTSTEVGSVIYTNLTNAESSSTGSASNNWGSTGFSVPSDRGGVSSIYWNMRRAPSFFDEVCYTGNGTAGATQAHNLGVVPEMMIVKCRGTAGENWHVYHSSLGNNANLYLASTLGSNTPSGDWNTTTPTATVFTLGGAGYDVNNNGQTFVAYLFATCAGVSKVGSYTGNGSTQTINCGFTGGARFVLVKRVDSTGGWYIWDTARGMVSGTDPSLRLNSAAAEINANWVYTTTGGFEIVSTDVDVNTSGGTYIYLAIA